MGIGVIVVEEIKRDPTSADLIISLYSSPYHSNFIDLSPQELLIKHSEALLGSFLQ
jgi:hypothetical protein